MQGGYNLKDMMDIARNMSRHLVKREDREDAEQEFLLGMLEAQSKSTNEDTQRSYEFKSGRCRMLSFLSEQKKHNFGTNNQFNSDDALKLAVDTAERPEDIAMQNDRERRLHAALNTLDERMRTVIKSRFFEEMTLDTVGEFLGVTRERVRQIEQEGLELLAYRMKTVA